jgi:anaerobic selenocysteine-containing dehydrogenase
VLPATAQMERADLPMVEGISLTTGTQYTDAVVPPAAERRPVWWILGQLGRRLGLDVLDGLDPDATDGRALLVRLADQAGADGAAVVAAGPRGVPGPAPEFGWVHDEVLPDGRFRLAPAVLVDRLAAELAAIDAARPATVLVPRRQLRSMNSARYESAARPEDPPWVRIGTDDAAAQGLADDAPVDLVGAHGRVRGRVRIDPRLRPGVVSLTHGWTTANVSRLTSATDAVDPLTGMPCLSAVPVRVQPV